MNILNTFKSTERDKYYFDLSDAKKIYEIEDFSIFKMHEKNYVHIYKDIAISQLCVANKDLINSIKDNELKEGCSKFLFDRAKESIKKGISINF